MGEPRRIIDPHIHLWDQRKTPRQASPLVKALGWHRGTLHWVARRVFPRAALEFFGAPDHVLADYLPADYAADAADRDVVGFVHVEAQWMGKGRLGPVGETRWLESLACPQLLGIVGHADLSLGDAVDEVLAAHAEASPRFRGVRQMLSHHPDKGVLDGAKQPGLSRSDAWRRGYAALARRGLSFEATIYDHQLPELADLAKAFPDVPIVLCHLATPVGFGGGYAGVGLDRDAVAGRWRDGMSQLAAHANVYVKLSGLAMPCLGWGYHQGDAPTPARVAEDFAPMLRFAIDAFGADRCMFASNFPVDKVSLSWATLYAAFESAVSDRTEVERRALFYDTAVRAYRLEP